MSDAARSAFIQRQIDLLTPGTALGDWPLRVCKGELNALPIDANSVYLWALRPDGVVLCMDHEALNHPTEPETDPTRLAIVLTRAARQHPELRSLMPAPPPGASTCRACGGEGDGSCRSCDGVGWRAR